VKISQAIRLLLDIQYREGDIEVELPDGRPLKKIEVVATPQVVDHKAVRIPEK
jgi:hypothetical protein